MFSGAAIPVPPSDPFETITQPVRATVIQRLLCGRGAIHRHLRVSETDVDAGEYCLLARRGGEDEFTSGAAGGGDGVGAGDGGQHGAEESGDYGADTGEWVGYDITGMGRRG